MPTASLCALLEHAIDYAGLFPPANLTLEPALRIHGTYVRTDDRWMLGTFVLPITKLEAASALLAQFDREYPLQISALGPKTQDATDFAGALETAATAIASFSPAHGDVAPITQFEMPLPPGRVAESLGKISAAFAKLSLKFFWEAPADSAAETIAALRDSGAGFKLRTGGVTADAFPTSAQIARALVAAAQHDVPIKFTAGLHHPVRKFHESVDTEMHGFLNVLGAGVLAAEHGWTEAQTEELIADQNAASFAFDDEIFSWRDWKISTAQIRRRRRLVTSLGSCSFDEPRDDLRELGLF